MIYLYVCIFLVKIDLFYICNYIDYLYIYMIICVVLTQTV